MQLAVTVRNMGPQSTSDILRQAALRAESLGFESIWITDHIAIPPDDAEGSGGRYTDPLTTLAWLGGATHRIKLGVGVLVAPYRPALPTAKAIATVQELTGNRLLLGVGVGWMGAEFAALGVDRRRRGRITDETLAFLEKCFQQDVVMHNGQPFLFRPRPAPPPIYIGGRPPQALQRAIRFGHGWLPMTRDPEVLAAEIGQFRELAARAKTHMGPVTAMAALPSDDPARARDLIDRYEHLGIERLVCAARYQTLEEYVRNLEAIAAIRSGA